MIKGNSKLLKRDALLCSILTVITTGVFYLFFINLAFLDPFEKAFEDFSLGDLYFSENFKDSNVSKKIILVNIKHKDRIEIAEAINKIGRQNPKVIGLDIIFKDKKEAAGDSILKAALSKYPNIVTSYYFEDKETVKNNSYFDTPNQAHGFINLNFENSSSVVRYFQGTKKVDNEKHYSFATQLAMKNGSLNIESNSEKFEEKLLINYTGNQSSFLTFDIEDILNKDSIPALKNSIVLLGYLGTPTGNPYDIEDKLFSPLNPKSVGKSTPDIYGLVVHANIINMLIEGDYIVKIPNYISYFLAFVCCFIMTLIALKIEKRSSFLYHLLIKLLQLISTIILLYITIVLLKYNIHLNVTPIIVLTLLGIEMVIYYSYLFHYLKKRFQWKSYLLDS